MLCCWFKPFKGLWWFLRVRVIIKHIHVYLVNMVVYNSMVETCLLHNITQGYCTQCFMCVCVWTLGNWIAAMHMRDRDMHWNVRTCWLSQLIPNSLRPSKLSKNWTDTHFLVSTAKMCEGSRHSPIKNGTYSRTMCTVSMDMEACC